MSEALKADGLDVGRHQAGTLMREVGAVAVRHNTVRLDIFVPHSPHRLSATGGGI